MAYKAFTTLQRGYTHPLFCEDFFFTHQLGQRYFVGAVMDGSTMGNTSFFAATLVAKLLRKACTTLVHQPKFDALTKATDLGEWLLKQLFTEFKQARNQLFLSKEETMTTLLLMVLDQTTQQAWVAGIGDGVIVANDEVKILDQNNQPDYLGYHVNKDFDTWRATLSQVWEFGQVHNLAIATDGVLAVEFPEMDKENPSVIKELMVNKLGEQNEHLLDKKIARLRTQHQADLQDDIAIVRLVKLVS